MSVATMLLLCGWSYAAEPAATSQPTENAWEKALNKMVSVTFHETPLNEVMDWFQKTTDLNLLVKWPVLKAIGVTESNPITIEIKNLPLEAAFRASLEAVRADGPVQIEFAVKDGILIVTTADDLSTSKMLVARVYDVTDIFSGTVPEQADALIASITQNIAPDTWRPTGSIGSIHYLGGLLTVTQTYHNQCAVKRLLSDLRKTGVRIHPSPTAQAQQAEPRMKLVSNMKTLCFDPQAMGIIAIGGLRTEVPQKREELIGSLTTLLEGTKSLGLRNAIRLTLKDIYVEMGDTTNALTQLRAIIQENDAALHKLAQGTVQGSPIVSDKE